MPSPPREVRAPTSGSPGFDEAGARRRGGAVRRKAVEGHVPADSVHRLRTRLMAQIRHSAAPGAQLELSGAPLKTIHEIHDEARAHLAELDAISRGLAARDIDMRWLGIGFHPTASQALGRHRHTPSSPPP